MAAALMKHLERMEEEELVARAYLIVGIAFWVGASVMALVAGQPQVFIAEVIVAAFCAAVLAIGWYYERSAALVLALAAMAMIAWGVTAGWQAGLWVMTALFLTVQFVIASALFAAARHEVTTVDHIEHGLPAHGART